MAYRIQPFNAEKARKFIEVLKRAVRRGRAQNVKRPYTQARAALRAYAQKEPLNRSAACTRFLYNCLAVVYDKRTFSITPNGRTIMFYPGGADARNFFYRYLRPGRRQLRSEPDFSVRARQVFAQIESLVKGLRAQEKAALKDRVACLFKRRRMI